MRVIVEVELDLADEATPEQAAALIDQLADVIGPWLTDHPDAESFNIFRR